MIARRIPITPQAVAKLKEAMADVYELEADELKSMLTVHGGNVLAVSRFLGQRRSNLFNIIASHADLSRWHKETFPRGTGERVTRTGGRRKAEWAPVDVAQLRVRLMATGGNVSEAARQEGVPVPTMESRVRAAGLSEWIALGMP